MTNEEMLLIPCSPWLAQLTFLHNPGSLAWCGTIQSGLGPHTSIISQENATPTCLWVNLTEAISQLEFPLP